MNSGYDKLMKSVMRDCNNGEGCFNPNGCDRKRTIIVPTEGVMKKYTERVCKSNVKCTHNYCGKFKWIIERAKHYGEKLDVDWKLILDSWEKNRNYWYMNYYQDSNQPVINADKVKVFETVDELQNNTRGKGFRCPSCASVSKSPYKCTDSCGWKAYGLLGCLGNGIFVYCKENLRGERWFMPISWENEYNRDI